MTWLDSLPLNYLDTGPRNTLRLLEDAYGSNPAQLIRIAKISGLQVGQFQTGIPPAHLPMAVMDRAANEGRLVELFAEILSDVSTLGIHEKLWILLGEDAQRVHQQALRLNPDFARIAALPGPSDYIVNGTKSRLERIVNVLAKFNDPAMFRCELAQREARIARIELSGKGVGTGWLVGPDLLLTANHVVAPAKNNWGIVRVRFDYKFFL